MSLPSEFGVTLLFEAIGTVAPSSSSPLSERDKTVAPVQRTVDRPEEARISMPCAYQEEYCPYSKQQEDYH